MQDTPTSASTGPDIAKGIGLVMLGHVAALVVAFGIGLVLTLTEQQGYEDAAPVFVPMFYVTVGGFVQILWVVPLVIWAMIKGRTALLASTLCCAGTFFLVNTGCWGLMATGF